MNAGLLDGVQVRDRPCEFSLESALVIELLSELGQPDSRLVEELEAGLAACRQPVRRQVEPQLVNLVGGSLDRSTPGHLVWGFEIAQPLDHLSSVFLLEIGVEHGEMWAPPDGRGERQQTDADERERGDAQPLRRRRALPEPTCIWELPPLAHPSSTPPTALHLRPQQLLKALDHAIPHRDHQIESQTRLLERYHSLVEAG